ncbi:esterase-like activity of phytase family protein [Hahella sp. HN01]|uniref:esterase-like activity of phytase family protein n=1 Tax=Hahella sp. HN01 TaxID=2847262 RepID=UPI001C1EDCF5|nr:esterase-like activity of phytase family protein [Hahella sp. HN01]MBU6954084.1 esterase-like activity of phytase family protein [Hahella sp. HN01]
MRTFLSKGAFTFCLSAIVATASAQEELVGALAYSVIKKLDNGVEVRNGGFGSAMTGHPLKPNHFYVLTDRGPNVDFDGPEGKGKKFPVPGYSPRIAEVERLGNGELRIARTLTLHAPGGEPITGLPNPEGMGATGETPYDYAGRVLGFDPYGLDPEGIAALKDGGFWVSDEYGPHIVHYSSAGYELERLNPFGTGTGGRKLPKVFANRRPNRGMEGLAITPDEQRLVGVMQSTLFNPSKKAVKNKTLTRILTLDIATGEAHQYLYRQEADNLSNSEIAAISKDEFLMVERDGGFAGEKAKYKRLYKIDLRGATDVSGDFDSQTGMQINGKALEELSWDELAAAGVQPVRKTLVVDLLAQMNYPHDKLEGLWIMDANKVAVINDDDFAVAEQNGNVAQKIIPATGRVDANTLYVIDLEKPLNSD